jgi:hypothetical protein
MICTDVDPNPVTDQNVKNPLTKGKKLQGGFAWNNSHDPTSTAADLAMLPLARDEYATHFCEVRELRL